jgi:hypothetical protein
MKIFISNYKQAVFSQQSKKAINNKFSNNEEILINSVSTKFTNPQFAQIVKFF